ncbi:Germinal-center associated nuclear protein [Schistosoma japonicum]|nr:Germinal-center associated nuclear protein [Schistosoma japonicum]
MFDSPSSEKATGLFTGISNNSGANLFQVVYTTDSKIPKVGLFGSYKATTELADNFKYSEPCFSSAHTVGKELTSKTAHHYSGCSGGVRSGQIDRPTLDPCIHDNATSNHLDFPESTNIQTKYLDSNDQQSTVNMYWPAVKLSRLPIGYNTKCFLQNHFQRFGRIERIICQPSMDVAYIAFNSLSSANRAKRLGREPVISGDALPSSVLFTMARCRRQCNSGPTPTSPELDPTGCISTSSHIFPTHTSLKRTIVSQPNIRQISNKKQFSSALVAGSDQSSLTLTPTIDKQLSPQSSKMVCNARSTVSPITLPNTSIYNNNCLLHQRSLSVTTLDERLYLLQECYKRDCELRSVSQSTDPKMQYSDVCNINTDEPIHHAPIKGTCEDMCPELERYSRESHQRVSIFECLPTTVSANSCTWEMDHTRAVKDYQRSSADQPVPLPRELRPTCVLQRTMAYLLASIADRPEIDTSRSLWKPWYEFMWTRTRAIRKDIRQQNLCCPTVISVIERIARFHIFCAARLVDQPVDSFDPRINSENLTQCLQTLKEMYSDLSSSIDTENLCPNEAEFRGYMLLMKLNDQNEINEAQRLPDKLRQSKPVRFAFDAYEALITNNYIRFFRLARQATCLVACLMHRYFVQIRGQALIRLSCAFAGHPKREVHYPISTLTRQLGFENEAESINFCETWGLSVLNSYVIFEKQIQPQPPSLPWKERRSFHLIENKRIGIPLSVLFNGSPIDPSDAIPPPVHSSFDSDGKYMNSQNKNSQHDSDMPDYNNRFTYNSVRDDCWIMLPTPLSVHQQLESNSSLLTTKPWSAGINTYNRKQMFNELLEFVYNDCVDEVVCCSNLTETVLLEEITINELIENLIADFIKEYLIGLFNDKLHLIRQLCKQIVENIINETLNLNLRNLAHREITLELLYNEYVNELIDELLHKLAISFLTMSNAISLYNYLLLKRCFNRFHHIIWKRKELIQHKILLHTMPTSVIADCLPLRLMIKTDQNNDNDKDVSVMKSIESSRCSRLLPEMAKLDDELAWCPLKPFSLFCKYPLGLYKSILMPMDTCSKTTQQHLINIFYWIYEKLKYFPLVLLNEWPNSSVISNKLSGIIVIGYFDHSITREQLMLMHSPDLVSKYDKDTIDRLLIIAITNSFQETTASFENVHNTLHDNDGIYFLRLSDPLFYDQKFQPSPFWSVNLLHGLSWLEECCGKVINLTQLNDQSTCHNKRNTRSEYSLSSSILNGERIILLTKLYHLIDEYIDITFFRPLAHLSKSWKLHGLIDPSMKSLLDEYDSIISRLLNQLMPVEKFLTDVFHDILTLPESVLNLICVKFHKVNGNNAEIGEDLVASSISWDVYIRNWTIVSKLLHFSATIDNWILTSFHKIESYFTSVSIASISASLPALPSSNNSIGKLLPSVYLAPNLNLCFALVRNCLNNLSNLLLNDNKVVHSIELVKLTEIAGIISKLISQIELDSTINQLNNYFKQLDEPRMTHTDAINLSLCELRKNNIENCLQSVRRRNASTRTEEKESLSVRLHKLSSKISEIENSMNDAIGETLNSQSEITS